MPTISVKTSFGDGKDKRSAVECAQPFTTAIVDPDWPYTVAPGKERMTNEEALKKGRLSGYTRSRDSRQNKYNAAEPLTLDELKGLPVGELVGGYVLLWCVGPFLVNGAGPDVLKAWGFEPCSIVTWAKYDLANNHGYGGVGYWFLGNAEFCIVGKRPGWPSIRTCRSSLIIAPKARHSQKPDDIHALCEKCFPGPYVELFGRDLRANWMVLGDQVIGDGRDIRSSIRRLL